MKDRNVRKRFGLNRFPNCFREYADMLTWFEPYRTVLDTSNPPFWKWFVGGRLNASYNCVDRHLEQYRNKAALIFVPEPDGGPGGVLALRDTTGDGRGDLQAHFGTAGGTGIALASGALYFATRS